MLVLSIGARAGCVMGVVELAVKMGSAAMVDVVAAVTMLSGAAGEWAMVRWGYDIPSPNVGRSRADTSGGGGGAAREISRVPMGVRGHMI